MQRIVSMFLVLVFAVSAFAVEGNQVRYVGGTVTGIKPDAIGAFELESQDDLTFDYQGGKLVIPYSRMTAYNYTREVTVHLGVMPAIAISLVKRRKRQHFVEITFTDEHNAKQVAVFEVAKSLPMVVMPVLQGRATCATGSGYKTTAPFASQSPYEKTMECSSPNQAKGQAAPPSIASSAGARR